LYVSVRRQLRREIDLSRFLRAGFRPAPLLALPKILHRNLDLQRKARQSGRPTDELIQLYALECFLDRLTQSAFARNLVLKGGVLLAAFDARRPTRDIDLAASSLRNTEAEILAVVREIAAISWDDGIAFDPERATAEIIREEDDYTLAARSTAGGTEASLTLLPSSQGIACAAITCILQVIARLSCGRKEPLTVPRSDTDLSDRRI
jgi:hypothetical protein